MDDRDRHASPRQGPGDDPSPDPSDGAAHEDFLFDGTPTEPVRRRRRRGGDAMPTAGKVAIGLFVLAAGAAAWFWLGPGGGPEQAGPAADSAAALRDSVARAESLAAARRDSIRRAEEAAMRFELPTLEASDSVIRRVAAGLSARPGWAAWLANDRLARRFVASVASVAAGSSPRQHVDFMAPEEDFAVGVTGADETVVAPAAFDRYDLAATTFASLDTDGLARLYERLHPLFQEAHRELGLPRDGFDATMVRAVERLLSVEVPEGPIEVVDDEGVYLFQDPALEELSPAAKHLLRMGPENARRVQEKLRELADALGLEVEG